MTHFSWGTVDTLLTALLWLLALWILISGIDDLIIDAVAWVVSLRKRGVRPSRPQLLSQPQKPIAILVPLWQESAVIRRMVQQNSASILYREYHIFIGAYPNDEATLLEVRMLEARYSHVHLAICPHNGPTSKADCLNWIFQNVIAYERERGSRFAVIVTHDAEDVIHSDALHWINYYADEFDMVQVPVLPLPTPVTYWTHGIYIDDFTEYQSRDMPARQAMGAFVPSNGVGTGYRREALDALADSDQNRVFEPVCLTEDYENGLRLRLRGARQMFLSLREGVATREYFPQTMHSAIRQRTRWVTGIALQTWDRHGWPGSLAQKYWLWRDRKGLIGNPASLLTNFACFFGLIASACGLPLPAVPMMKAGAILAGYRLVYRMACVARVYGISIALAAPVRVVVANLVNSAATFRAVRQFALSKIRREPLVWLKTEHAYPRQSALAQPAGRLGEILVQNGYITPEQLATALATKPPDVRIGEHLVASSYLDEDSLYEALSLQLAVPQIRLEPWTVSRAVTRSLPRHVVERHKLIPFKVDSGRLLIAGPECPTVDLRDDVGRFTSLEVEYHLVTPTEYQALVTEFLPV